MNAIELEATTATDTAPYVLQTMVPSAVRIRNGDGAGSVLLVNTLLGSQNRKPLRLNNESLPDGWTRHKHPDKGIYYVNEEKGLCTPSDVLNPTTRALIMKSADELQQNPALDALLMEQEIDLVLEVQRDNTPPTVSYYCVCHIGQQVFWLEGVGNEKVDVNCTSSKCAKGSRVHCIEAQYWKHCELFPSTFPVNKKTIDELKNIILQAAADRLLVKFSTSPYGKQDLEYMLNLVKEIGSDIREQNSHSAWIIARFMTLYNDGVLRSSYGQSDDYFDIDDTRPDIPPYKRPLLLAVLAPLFLKSPDVFAAELYSFHENFTPERWSRFVHKVDQSIRDSNLLATVLLTTNVGFLSWSDGGRTGGLSQPTPAQIVTYVSIICSVGSIIVGLVIFKQYRAKGADTPLRAVVVLKRILKESFGLERLAIICSLPYVLLMWGLIAFLVAFGIIFYDDTGIQVRVPVSLTLFVMFLFLFSCFHTAGPPDKEDKIPLKRSRVVASVV